MADNDQNNDEYRFVEEDNLDTDITDNTGSAEAPGHHIISNPTNIKRNAIIAIIIVVFIMIMYKLFGYVFSKKPDDVALNPPISVVTQATTSPTPGPTVVTPIPVSSMVQPVEEETSSELARRIAAMELSQENVRTEVGTVSQQVGTVNNNINNLNTQLANLNQVINTLTSQLAKQSDEIADLRVRLKPKHKVKTIFKVTSTPVSYYIKAVIPGRAWLIGTNGSTLTVREGTKIAGYGVVKLIDPLEGRVLMNSGRVIRFSQEDS